LTTLTVLFLIAAAARRFVWIVIIAAWILLVVRFGLEVAQPLLK
jgi:hypothetical protein